MNNRTDSNNAFHPPDTDQPNPVTQEKWRFDQIHNFLTPNLVNVGILRHDLSDWCLTPLDRTNLTSGRPVLLDSCDRNPGQKWLLAPDQTIRNLNSGLCLGVAGSPGVKNGTALLLEDCENFNAETDQRWQLRADGFLQNLTSQRCVDVPGAANGQQGSQLQLWDCEINSGQVTDQVWWFLPLW